MHRHGPITLALIGRVIACREDCLAKITVSVNLNMVEDDPIKGQADTLFIPDRL